LKIRKVVFRPERSEVKNLLAVAGSAFAADLALPVEAGCANMGVSASAKRTTAAFTSFCTGAEIFLSTRNDWLSSLLLQTGRKNF